MGATYAGKSRAVDEPVIGLLLLFCEPLSMNFPCTSAVVVALWLICPNFDDRQKIGADAA